MVFICSGYRCYFKLFYPPATDFRFGGLHCCSFDIECECQSRERHLFIRDVIGENVTLRPRDIVNLVILEVSMSEREKRSLQRFAAHRLSAYGVKLTRTFADLILPECLEQIINAQRDIGDSNFPIHYSKIDNQSAERILVFASYSVKRRAAFAKELYADGTYRAESKMFATPYTIHTTTDDYHIRSSF